MKTNWKRNVCVVLAAVMMMAGLTACSSDAQVPGFDISVRSTDSSDNGTTANNSSGTAAGTDSTSGSGGNNATTSDNQTSNNTASTLPDVLIPPGATVTSGREGSLVLACSQPVDDVIAFYKKALNTLGAKEESVVNSTGTWSYRGTYSGGDISIVVSVGVISVRY